MQEARAPSRWHLLKEGASFGGRIWRTFGRLGERGPEGGERLMVIPGFLANDRTTLGLQRAFAKAGYRVTGWGLGLNDGVKADTIERVVRQIEGFAGGGKVVLVGWSLGGVFAREAAKARPELVSKVVTLGSPFSGDKKANNIWRLYERVAGHPVETPPIDTDTGEKPKVPTLAIWSRRDGIVAVGAARGEDGERDAELEIGCTHMGFALSGRGIPKVVEAVKRF